MPKFRALAVRNMSGQAEGYCIYPFGPTVAKKIEFEESITCVRIMFPRFSVIILLQSWRKDSGGFYVILLIGFYFNPLTLYCSIALVLP